MRVKWGEISPEDFEVVVAALLRAMGFENVRVRPPGSDDGWDIDAQTVVRAPDGTVSMPTWRVECKRYKSKPRSLLIRDHLQRMIETPPKPDNVLFVSTAAFGRELRVDLENKGREHHISIHVWDRKPLEEHAFDHLADRRLRGLLVGHIDVDLSVEVLEAAAEKQVAAEIQSRVGRKYIPELYHSRLVENSILGFLSTPPRKAQVEEFVGWLRGLGTKAVRASDVGKWEATVTEILKKDSLEDAAPQIGVLCELTRDAQEVRDRADAACAILRNCLLLKDRAGSGKTSLFCHMATHMKHHGTIPVFLSCKFDLSESRSLDLLIADALQPHLRAAAEGHERAMLQGDDLLAAVFLTLENAGRQLVVFLDGINENRDLARLDQAILGLLLRWNRCPVKFVVSCRDIFWSFFSEDQWQSFLHGGTAFELPEFANHEVDATLPAYFRRFRVKGEVRGEARQKCRHPLLLRFFCEAHTGRDVRLVEDIRLKDLFEEYWKRKVEDISQALGWGRDGGIQIEEFVFRLAGWMSDHSTTQVVLRNVPIVTGHSDLVTDRSIYRRLLDQDIILEELPSADSLDTTYQARRVSFVYDEFYDYISALAHVRKQEWDNLPSGQVCWDFGQIVVRSGEFEQFRGVAEYLVLICEKKDLHKPFCALLARMAQYQLLCNVLPKLQSPTTDWVSPALCECLLAVDRAGPRKRDRARQQEDPGDVPWEEIRAAETAADVFRILIPENEPPGERREAHLGDSR